MPLTVEEIQSIKFIHLPREEQLRILKEGRPTPEVVICQEGVSKKKKFLRSFNDEWYIKKQWLCASDVKMCLYCFPCLLLGDDTCWSKDGFKNLNKLKEQSDKHEISVKHLDNILSLALIEKGTSNSFFIDGDEEYPFTSASINKHNLKVQLNRDILSKIINCIKIYGNYEICLLNEESNSTEKTDVFKALFSFIANFDPDVKKNLSYNPIFQGIETEILENIEAIYREYVIQEIAESSYVSVLVEDISDVSDTNDLVIVFRYELKRVIYERFWGIFAPDDLSAESFAQCILEQIDIVLKEDYSKLIAQTYDGSCFMGGIKKNIESIIRAKYSNAPFIHCYAHQINLIMKNVASITTNSRIFFSYLLGIPQFFSKNPSRLVTLNKYMANESSVQGNRWTFNSVYKNFTHLKNCFEEIVRNSTNDQTIRDAVSLLQILNEDYFLFWLELFRNIMPHIDIIYNKMHSRQVDPLKIPIDLKKFHDSIEEIRNLQDIENPILNEEKNDICNNINEDINFRYSFTDHLQIAKLFYRENFLKYTEKKTPINDIKENFKAFPMIDLERLFLELQILYNRKEMNHFKKLTDLLEFILKNDIKDIFIEVTKLVKILVTLPMSTDEQERCLFTIKKIKTYLRNSKNNFQLPVLILISVENAVLNRIPNFNNEVIDRLSVSEHRKFDFQFHK